MTSVQEADEARRNIPAGPPQEPRGEVGAAEFHDVGMELGIDHATQGGLDLCSINHGRMVSVDQPVFPT